MTIVEMAAWFDTLQDKFGSPYFDDIDKTKFLQRAHIGFVEEMLFPQEPRENIEASQDNITAVAPLIFSLPLLNMTSAGYILKSSVQTALTAMSATAVLWRPLSVGISIGLEDHPAKLVRHNDIWAFRENYFKRPSQENPKFTETSTEFRFLPINVGAKVYFTVLKYPRAVVIDTATPANNVNSDLPDFTHDRIVALALEYAGVASRDVALAQMIQLKK